MFLEIPLKILKTLFNFLYQKNIPNIMMRLKIWIQFLKTMKYILFKQNLNLIIKNIKIIKINYLNLINLIKNKYKHNLEILSNKMKL